MDGTLVLGDVRAQKSICRDVALATTRRSAWHQGAAVGDVVKALYATWGSPLSCGLMWTASGMVMSSPLSCMALNAGDGRIAGVIGGSSSTRSLAFSSALCSSVRSRWVVDQQLVEVVPPGESRGW